MDNTNLNVCPTDFVLKGFHCIMQFVFWTSYCEHHLCATYWLGCTITQNKDGIAYTVHPIAKPKVQNKHSISLETKLLIIPNYHFENNWRIHTYCTLSYAVSSRKVSYLIWLAMHPCPKRCLHRFHFITFWQLSCLFVCFVLFCFFPERATFFTWITLQIGAKFGHVKLIRSVKWTCYANKGCKID